MGKAPGSSTAIPWHQDTFTTHVGFKWTPETVVDAASPQPFTLWVALDDVCCDNGGMQVIAGRHREVLGAAVPEDKILHDERIEYKMRAGQAGIHHPLTPHRSCANSTSSARRAFLVRFAPWTDRVETQCGSSLEVVRRAGDGYTTSWRSSPACRYAWLPGNSDTLAEKYRLNRLLTCKAGSYSYNTSNYNLTAQCLNARGSYVSTTIKLNNCFNADSNYNLELRGSFGNYLYTDCKTCSLNLKTLFLTCNCEGRTTNPLNLNIWVLNSGGSLVC